MVRQIGPDQPGPPVPAGAGRRLAAQVTGKVVVRRVDHAHWHVQAGLFDGEPQVTVVRDNQRSIDGTAEHVQQEVRARLTSEPFSSRLA